MFIEISRQTQIEFSLYSDAKVDGEAINSVIAQIEIWRRRIVSVEAAEFLTEFLRIAKFTHSKGKSLSYFGI